MRFRFGIVLGAALAVAVALPPAAAQASGARTVTFAESAGAAPNYIFPFETLAFYSVANVQQFQYLMYRPLYWFGSARSVELDPRLSLARGPVFSDNDRVVTITLKPYRWSDGERVDARDVLFWLNVWHAEPTRYVGWFRGGRSLPTSLGSVGLEGPTTLRLRLRFAVNPTWFTDNQLSEITPLPLAWTRTSISATAGSAGCAHAPFGTGAAACGAVYDFLSEQSGFDPARPTTTVDALTGYGTNPLWQVVDGPWRLASFGRTQPSVFVSNPRYSGPDKPRVHEFVEEPFTSTAAELHALVDGSIDVGYLPPTSLTAGTTTAQRAGPNPPALGGRYRMSPVYPWEIDYWTYNFDSTGDTGNASAILRQLYVRRAMQMLVDQPALITEAADGYGVPTVGPVPLVPRTPFTSAVERKDPYPYEPGRAARLLRSHGWSVVPGGTDTCTRAGRGPDDCGTGVRAGAELAFDIHVESFTARLTGLVTAEAKSWGRVGIRASASGATFDQVVNFSMCPPACGWEITAAVDWTYEPDIYPSGEELFEASPGADNGHAVTREIRALVARTVTTEAGLDGWEDYAAERLPFLWEPVFAREYSEIDRALKAPPPGPLGTITPATWSWDR